MADESLQQQLRRALSYRAKVQRLEAEAAGALKKNTLEQERYDALREFYIAHATRAGQAIQDVRRRIQARLVVLDDEIQEVIGHQTDLGQRVSNGQMDPDIANRRNREYIGQIAAKQEERNTLIAIAGADEPGAAGGFIDLPLEDYARTVRVANPLAIRLARFLAFFVPFVIASMVFLPWVEIQGAPHSLRTIGTLIANVPMQYMPIVGMVWLVFFVVPLLSLCFTALNSHRSASRGMIAIGFITLVLMIAGLVTFPLVAKSPAVTLLSVISGLGAGALGYMVGALAIIFLGRARGAEESRSRVSFGLPYAAAASAAMVLIAALGVLASTVGGAVAVSASFAEADQGLIRVRYANASGSGATVHLPWPGSPGGGLGDRFGTSVFVREPGQSEFRLLPDSERCWNYSGNPVGPGNSIQLGPKRTMDVLFDARYLPQLGIQPEAVRLVMTNAFSDVMGTFDFAMPTDLPPPPAVDRPVSQVQARALPPTASPSSVYSTPLPQRPAETERAAPKPGNAAPLFRIRVVGMLPNPDEPGAIIEIIAADGSRNRISVKEGERVVEGWLLDRVRGRDGITLMGERVPERLSVPYRTTVEVSPP